MTGFTELQLRKLALVLTVLLGVQALWGVGSLLLLAEPEPIMPAEESLRVDTVRAGPGAEGEPFESLAVRPLFWQGRESYTPPSQPEQSEEKVGPADNSAIDKVKLLGVYSYGEGAGIIISYKEEQRRLRQDESVAGWTFTMLSENGAFFESGDTIKELPLEHARPRVNAKGKRSGSRGRNDSQRARQAEGVDEAPDESANNSKDNTGD